MVKEDILLQHKNILLRGLEELSSNNTSSLINDDIVKGVISPPLDAMDDIKNRIIKIAKHNELILDNKEFVKMLDDYKDKVTKTVNSIYLKRNVVIKDTLLKIDVNKPLDILKSLKKDLNKFNKETKKIIKSEVLVDIKDILINKVKTFGNLQFEKEVSKYLESIYLKKLNETIEMKVLIKDTILINSIKEQLERFVYTKENSHLFD